MKMAGLICDDERRRQLARRRGLNGLDYVEVSDDQLTLTVYFLAKAPPEVTEANIRIDGGRRVRGIRVTGVTMCRADDPELDDCMTVTVDRFGDFSTYRLCLVEPDEHGHPGDRPMAGIDPRYACVDFSFKIGCPSSLDCAAEELCPPRAFAEPELSYLAKDYASFRQLILDRLAVTMPGWTERHVPDVGITLVDLLAYAGDYLSYHQDAVATEAYLDTARLRVSVRRHARLVDYVVHEGCNARAWVHVATDTDVTLPADIAFITSPDDPDQPRPALTWDDLRTAAPAPYETFLPVVARERPVHVGHNQIRFHTWGDRECCLARGSTEATLLGDLHLAAGDVLIFEEVLGPVSGDPADADPAHRHAVRLTAVEPTTDPVTGDAIVEIAWAAEDALPFPLCISSVGPAPECATLEDVSVAHGNVILTDHGQWVRGEVLGTVPAAAREVPCAGSPCDDVTVHTPGRFRPTLREQPLTFAVPLPGAAPAAALCRPQPRQARPQINVANIPLAPGGEGTLYGPGDFEHPEGLVLRLRDPEDVVAQALRGRLSPATRKLLDEEPDSGDLSTALRGALLEDLRRLLEPWTAVPDLLSSGPDDPHHVVETDNEGRAHLRFGDGEQGRQPEANACFLADYRVGNGPEGNVGADTILRIVFGRTTIRADLRPRNPLPACGGASPEPIGEVKLRAPTAFRQELARAVTADDYARLAERHDGVQRAAATPSWTGSWIEMRVAVDALGGVADPELLADIRRMLEPYRRILHDLVVVPATYVPLRVALTVCVLPRYLRGHVEAALRQVLGSRRLPDGRIGFFHPDNLTFGADIYLSRLVATAQAVQGVESAEVTVLQRLHGPVGRELEEGVLRLSPLEVPQLDNDPNFPENGRLELTVEGGR